MENTPVNPLDVFSGLHLNLSRGGVVIGLLLILGAATEMLSRSGAISSLVDTGIKKYKDKSISVLIPSIYLLMTVLGALAGNDSMIAYVAIGIAISKKLKLDRMCAVGMFYLPYVTGLAVGPTSAILLLVQEMIGIPPMSGAVVRVIMLVIFYAMGATFVTRYANKVSRDPSKSILGQEGLLFYTPEEQAIEDAKTDVGKFELKAFLAVASVVLSYFVFAFGAKTYGWSWGQLCSCIMVSAVLVGVYYRMTPNEVARAMMAGACKMGGVCFLMGFAMMISATLTQGQIMDTIAHSAAEALGGLGGVGSALGIFAFVLIFNLLMPGGITKIQTLLPITMPIGEVMNIDPEVMGMTMQFGDGLTNCMTPMSSVLMGALALGGVAYPMWIKFSYKFVAATIVVAASVIVFSQLAL